MKIRMTQRVLTIMTAAFLLAIAASAHAEEGTTGKEPAVASAYYIDVVAGSASDLNVFVTQKWSGEDAKRMRQSLDVYFGAGDGALTPSDVDRIARATETDMENETLSWLTLGGEPYVVSSVAVTFGNATGSVEDLRELTMVHQLELTSAADATDISLVPMWDGQLSFAPPEGWHVADATGLADATTDHATTSGQIARAQEVTLALAPGDAPADPATGRDEVGESVETPASLWSLIPLAAAGAAVLLALCAGALVLMRRRDRKRN